MEKLSKVVVWEFFQLLLTSVTGLAIPPGVRGSAVRSPLSHSAQLPVVLVALPNSRQCETEADYLGYAPLLCAAVVRSLLLCSSIYARRLHVSELWRACC